MIEQIVIHLSMEQKLINSKFKAKNSGLVASLLCLANISKDWIIWNKAGFNGYIYDFSVDYIAITVNDIKDIHKYLMKKNDIV